MSNVFLTWLSIAVALILASRLAFAFLPLRTLAARLSVIDVAVVTVGVVGLAFHCGAMFFRSEVAHLPGLSSAIRAINAMGTASKLWYAVPAILVIVGLRRQYPVALVVVAVALTVVGITMYDHGSLTTHLRAIFSAVVILAATGVLLVRPPWQSGTSADQRV